MFIRRELGATTGIPTGYKPCELPHEFVKQEWKTPANHKVILAHMKKHGEINSDDFNQMKMRRGSAVAALAYLREKGHDMTCIVKRGHPTRWVLK